MQPVFGRAFTTDECQPGRDTVIILSDGFAQSYFGSARNAVGQKMELNGRAYQVIGVMPAEIQVKSWFPAAKEAWIPLAWTHKDRAVRGNHNYLVHRPPSRRRERREAQTAHERHLRSPRPRIPGRGQRLGRRRDSPPRLSRRRCASCACSTLLGAVGFVLLIACANTANLVLARTIARRKELAIRAALGASAGQALRPVLVETMLLALAGGAIGLILARSAQSLVTSALAEQLPRATEVRARWPSARIYVARSVLTGLAAGLIARGACFAATCNESLKQGFGKTDADSGGNRTRNASWSSPRSPFPRAAGRRRTDDPKPLGALRDRPRLLLPERNHHVRADSESRRISARAAAFTTTSYRGRRVARCPVGRRDRRPASPRRLRAADPVDGRPAEMFALQRNVSVRHGQPRLFPRRWKFPSSPAEIAGSKIPPVEKPVVVISQAMANVSSGPARTRSANGCGFPSPEILRTVVGVVGDIKNRGLDALEPVTMFYEPSLRRRPAGVPWWSAARQTSPALRPRIGGVLANIDPGAAHPGRQNMEELVETSLSQHRFTLGCSARSPDWHSPRDGRHL